LGGQMGHSAVPDSTRQRGLHAPDRRGGSRPPHPPRARRGGARRPRRRTERRPHDRRRLRAHGPERRPDRLRHRGPREGYHAARRSESVVVEIHEYQAKELLTAFGVPVPKGGVAYSADQAVYRATEIGGLRWVVKAQIHAGARGKAGGIRLCSTDADVRQAVKELPGKTAVTAQ